MTSRHDFMMTRRSLLRTTGLAAGSVAALAALAACGKQPGQGSGGSQGAAATIWSVQSSQADSYQAAVDRWNKNHPDEKIDIQIMPNNGYKDKIRVALGAGEAPTLFYTWGGGGVRTYVKEGLVTPISDLATGDYADFFDRYLPAPLEAVTIDGKIYGAPIANMQPAVFLYNKQIFADQGLDVPETWEDLLGVISSLRGAGIQPIALAGQSKWPELPYLAYLVDRLGGPEVFKNIEADQADGWSDPAVLKAAEMIQDLVKAGAFNDDYAATAYESGAVEALMYSGKTAMILMLSTAYSNIAAADPDFVAAGTLGWFGFPTVAGGKGDPADLTGNPSTFWSMDAKASDAEKDVAMRFMYEELMNDQYVDEIIGRDAVPAATSAEAKLKDADAPFSEWVFESVSKAPAFQLSLDQALSPAQGETLNTTLDQLFLLEITPQEFVDTMNATVGK